MPVGVSVSQAVVIRGKVYIGGGESEGSEYDILEYTIQGGQWRQIKTPVRYFSMTAVNDQVVIIGGKDEEDKATDRMWVLDSLSDTWLQPFPWLPEAKYWTSAVSYKKWVLVVGGEKDTDDDECDGECPELYLFDTTRIVWYTASPLPRGAFQPSLTVMHDTLFVVWGNSTVNVSIPALISDAVFRYSASDTFGQATNKPRPIEWELLPNVPTVDPAIVFFHDIVLIMGESSSAVTMYCPQTEQWLKVAELPTPRRACTCVVLPDSGELMVIGGHDGDGNYIKTIDLCML